MITPCVGLCKIDQTTLTCMGCNRTSLEIQNWTRMSESERYEVMVRLGYFKRMGREERLRRYDRG